MSTFSGDYISPLMVLAPEIFTHARHWTRLASAHYEQGRGPPKNVKGEHLNKIPHMRAYNFGGSGRLTKLY